MKKNSFVWRYGAFFLSTLIALSLFSSCSDKDADLVKPKTITDVILQNNDFTIFREIVASSKMSDALRTENLTLFAPNDAAFRRSGITSASVITSLPGDSAQSFILYHLHKGRVEYSALKAGNLEALNGQNLVLSKRDSTIVVNKADIILKDVNADNGIIHVIDRVLTAK
ncbi:fasciclin domain-containing protein [Dyadobacter helix]|nr:fasciclin domain-containing protein [Dyadobacter sp. CECT 9275]